VASRMGVAGDLVWKIFGPIIITIGVILLIACCVGLLVWLWCMRIKARYSAKVTADELDRRRDYEDQAELDLY